MDHGTLAEQDFISIEQKSYLRGAVLRVCERYAMMPIMESFAMR